jgi:hypothetical protein
MRIAIAVGVMPLVLLASWVAHAEDDPDAWKLAVEGIEMLTMKRDDHH